MKPTSIWRIMTPIKDRVGPTRWVHSLIVAVHEREAEKVADQLAGALGISFDGDIAVQHVANATTEDGE